LCFADGPGNGFDSWQLIFPDLSNITTGIATNIRIRISPAISSGGGGCGSDSGWAILEVY